MNATAASCGITANASVIPVREVIELAVAVDGIKRGLYRAADALGVSERWLRGFRSGDAARVSAEIFIRAVEAARVLRAERREQLLAELRALDAADDAEWLATITQTHARIAALETENHADLAGQVASARVDAAREGRRSEGRGMGRSSPTLARLVTR